MSITEVAAMFAETYQLPYDLQVTASGQGAETPEKFLRQMGKQPITYAASLAAFNSLVAKAGARGNYASLSCPGAKVSYEFFPEERAMMQVIAGDDETSVASGRPPGTKPPVGKVVIETSATRTYAIVKLLLPYSPVAFYVWSDRVVVATGLEVWSLTPEGRVAGGQVPPGIFLDG